MIMNTVHVQCVLMMVRIMLTVKMMMIRGMMVLQRCRIRKQI